MGLLAGVWTAPPAIPLTLQRAYEARDRLRTARIEYAVTDESDTATVCYVYSFAAADDRYFLTHHGDPEDGLGGPDGKPLPPAVNRPQQFLSADGEVWRHATDTAVAHVFPSEKLDSFRMFDVRQVGLNPFWFDGKHNERLSSKQSDTKIVAYDEQKQEDGQVVITVRHNSEWTGRWWIDPAKDYAVTRTATYQGDRTVADRRYEHRLNTTDGVWFPRKVIMYRGPAETTPAWRTIDIFSAEFNRADHDLELTPEDIGVGIGTKVIVQNESDARAGRWDGKSVVSGEEFDKRLAAGEFELGTSYLAAVGRSDALYAKLQREGRAPKLEDFGNVRLVDSRLIAENTSADGFDTQWELYTRAFIERFTLDEEQTQRAWAVCQECTERGKQYVTQQAARLREIKEHRIAVQSESDREVREALAKSLAEGESKLNEPLRKIFETRLVPGLDAIPTRAQRESETKDTKKPEPKPKSPPKP